MENSILNSIKKLLHLDISYDAFDVDVIIHINSALSALNQIGVGPEEGFAIDSADQTWDAFLSDPLKTNMARTYVYLSVRLAFDPPTTSNLVASIEKQLDQLTWRLSVTRTPSYYEGAGNAYPAAGIILDVI